MIAHKVIDHLSRMDPSRVDSMWVHPKAFAILSRERAFDYLVAEGKTTMMGILFDRHYAIPDGKIHFVMMSGNVEVRDL